MNLKEYIHKAVGICGVSAGPFGGARVIENIAPVMRELGLVIIFEDLGICFSNHEVVIEIVVKWESLISFKPGMVEVDPSVIRDQAWVAIVTLGARSLIF